MFLYLLADPSPHLGPQDGYQLVLVKTVDSSQEVKEEEGSPKNKTLNRHDSYFRQAPVDRHFILMRAVSWSRGYLFQCVDDSEPVSAEVCCRHHLASPLRDTSGCAAAVLDLTLSQPIVKLSSQQSRDIAKTVKLLGKAFLQMRRQEEKRVDGEDQSATAIFHQLLLSDLSSSLSRVDNR